LGKGGGKEDLKFTERKCHQQERKMHWDNDFAGEKGKTKEMPRLKKRKGSMVAHTKKKKSLVKKTYRRGATKRRKSLRRGKIARP